MTKGPTEPEGHHHRDKEKGAFMELTESARYGARHSCKGCPVPNYS